MMLCVRLMPYHIIDGIGLDTLDRAVCGMTDRSGPSVYRARGS